MSDAPANFDIHAFCGGKLVEIGIVVISWAEVPKYRCEACGHICDASDYDQFQGYYDAKKQRSAT